MTGQKTEPEQKIKHYTESLFYEIQKTAKYLRVLGEQFFENINQGLTHDEFCAIDVILSTPGICQRDLAKIILKDRASTGRILNSLEQKGFITRQIDTKNNRLVRKLEVTENGKKVIEEITKIIIPSFQQLYERVTKEEIEALRLSLSKFTERLSETVKMQI